MLRGHKRIEKQNFESRVVLKKGSQEIGFVPRSSFLQPAFGILERPQNIVEMNNNSLFQEWQDLERAGAAHRFRSCRRGWSPRTENHSPRVIGTDLFQRVERSLP